MARRKSVIGILTALQHPRHPVERPLRIAAAQRLVISGEHVEVLFTALVVSRHPAAECLDDER